MSNLAAEIEGTIRAHHLPDLADALPQDEFILPRYADLSLVNLPATIAALLGVTLPGAPPLRQDIWEPFAGGVRCVIRVIIDALGYYRLQRLMTAHSDTLFHRLLDQGACLVPLTSVCPSTTVSALSSLWTGYTPAAHGLLGTRLFLRDKGLQAHMIHFNPIGFKHRNALLEEGMEAEQFLPVPGMATRLAAQGIESHVFINRYIANGGLSDIFFRGVKTLHGCVAGSSADMWNMLCHFVNEHAGERLFISVYWELIDSLSHQRGPSSPIIDAQVRSWTAMMQREFLDRLSPAAAAGTVLTFVSDHGQVDTLLASAVHLNQHPQLSTDLLMKPVGEARLPFLYARQGRVAAIQRYVREHLNHAFVALDSTQALEAGLFGPGGSLAPETAARLGDLILVARRDHILYDRDEEVELLGLHGGLSAEEMLVPFMITRLDG